MSRRRRASGTQILGRELFRIDLGTLLSTVLVTDRLNPLYPAADPASNLIVYTDPWQEATTAISCRSLTARPAATISYGQPRYGTHSSWYGGKVLTNGYRPAKGGGLRCDRSGNGDRDRSRHQRRNAAGAWLRSGRPLRQL